VTVSVTVTLTFIADNNLLITQLHLLITLTDSELVLHLHQQYIHIFLQFIVIVSTYN